MLVRVVPILAVFVCVLILVILIKTWKQKVLSWGWLGLLMIFLPQAQGMFRPNQIIYVIFGLVSTFAGILIFTYDITRENRSVSKEAAQQ